MTQFPQTVNHLDDSTIDDLRMSVGVTMAGGGRLINPFHKWTETLESRLSVLCQVNALLFTVSRLAGFQRVQYESIGGRAILNHYGAILAPSGTGKDHTVDKLEEMFSRPLQAVKQAKELLWQSKENEEKDESPEAKPREIREALKYKGFAPMAGLISHGTPEGLREKRRIASMYKAGGVDVRSNEMGASLNEGSGYTSFMSVLIEAYGGTHYDKAIKGDENPTSCSGVPTSFLGLSSLSPFKDKKTLKDWNRLLGTGLARRAFISMSDSYAPTPSSNADLLRRFGGQEDREAPLEALKAEAMRVYETLKEGTKLVRLTVDAKIAMVLIEEWVMEHTLGNDALDASYYSIADKTTRLACWAALLNGKTHVTSADIMECLPMAIAFHKSFERSIQAMAGGDVEPVEKVSDKVIKCFEEAPDGMPIADFRERMGISKNVSPSAFEDILRETSDALDGYTLSIVHVHTGRRPKKLVVLVPDVVEYPLDGHFSKGLSPLNG
jgi:hypothetical protein